MKRIALVFAFVALVFSFNAAAQENNMFGNNSKLLKVGAGLGANGIPLEVSYEKGFKQNLFGVENLNLGLGGYFGFYHYNDELGSLLGENYGFKYNNFVLGARGLFHYTFFPKVDTYLGLMLGYNIASSKYYGPSGYSDDASAGGIVFGSVVGARYQFNSKWGVYGELGYSIAYASFGVVYKL
ncbi:hypothetical protein DSECCO2_135950 [anaerobic digester metagenome]